MAVRKPYIPKDLTPPPRASRRPLLRVEDVAEQWQVSRASVYRALKSGRLKAVKIGAGTLRFRPEDVEAAEVTL
jgi:excisionase family DNA binding protein